MNLECRQCHKAVDSMAEKCPHCKCRELIPSTANMVAPVENTTTPVKAYDKHESSGQAKAPRPPETLKVLFIIILAVLGVVFLFIYGTKHAPSSGNSAPQKSSEEINETSPTNAKTTSPLQPVTTKPLPQSAKDAVESLTVLADRCRGGTSRIEFNRLLANSIANVNRFAETDDPAWQELLIMCQKAVWYYKGAEDAMSDKSKTDVDIIQHCLKNDKSEADWKRLNACGELNACNAELISLRIGGGACAVSIARNIAYGERIKR